MIVMITSQLTVSVAWDNSTYLWLAQVLFVSNPIVIIVVIDCGDGLFSKQRLSVSGKTCLMAVNTDARAGRSNTGFLFVGFGLQ